MNQTMNNYKYDIAISLCKEDVDYAEALKKELNPKLQIFLYTQRLEELIGESGPEKFGKVFKEEARVILILYREKWGNSYYTALERDAIVDRTTKPDEGYNFIVVVGMEPGKVPSWYPSTRIYANPMIFSTSQIASFVEYKVNERGGNVSPLSFEEQTEFHLNKMEDRKELIRFLQSSESVSCSLEELDKFVNGINEKISFAKELDPHYKIRI